jgi:ABC-type phosphate/phosphonate transport system permease subunit
MKASLFYRIAFVLLILFAVGHTLGFRRVDPRWGVDSLIQQLRSTHFDVQGFNRSYWDFFTGFGFFVTILLLFAAIVSWQLGSLPKESLSTISLITWGLAICFIVVTFLSYQYFFMVPVVFSGATAVCLILGAWLAGRP